MTPWRNPPPWNATEDRALALAVSELACQWASSRYSKGFWPSVASAVGTRGEEACRRRARILWGRPPFNGATAARPLAGERCLP